MVPLELISQLGNTTPKRPMAPTPGCAVVNFIRNRTASGEQSVADLGVAAINHHSGVEYGIRTSVLFVWYTIASGGKLSPTQLKVVTPRLS